MVFNLKNQTSGTLAVNYYDLSGVEQTSLVPAQQTVSLTGASLAPQTLALIDGKQLAYNYGPSGGPPPPGSPTSLRFALTWNGPWVSQFQYVPGNVVSYSGTMWVCSATHTSSLTPNNDTDNWFQFAIFNPSTFLGLDPTSLPNGAVVFASGGSFTASLLGSGNINPSGLPESSITGLVNDLSSKISRNGDTITSPLSLNYTPSNSLHAVPRGWVQSNFVPVGGGTVSGPINYAGTPVSNTEYVNKKYVDTVGVNSVPLAGGTMTGLLLLSGPPTSNNGAATKAYVDTSTVPVSGGTVSGPIKYAADPSDPNEYTRKSWVLAQLAAGFTVTGRLYTNNVPSGSTEVANKAYVDTTALAGGTLAGPLSWPTPPASANQLANKAYVDAQVATSLPLSGGTVSGPIKYAADPSDPNEYTRKSWVLAQLSGGGGGGGYLPTTGGSMTGGIGLWSDSVGSGTGLKFNPTLNAPAYGPLNIVTTGGVQLISGPYTVTPNDGLIYADASGGSIPVTFPAPSGFGLQEVTIMKTDANAYTQVYIEANGVDNRNSDFILSYPGESISLTPEGGIWAVTRRFLPTLAGKAAALSASGMTVSVSIFDRYQTWSVATVANNGGYVAFTVINGSLWQVGGAFEAQQSANGYTGYYTIGSISVNTLITTTPWFGSGDTVRVLGIVQPNAAQLCTVALALSTDPSNPWLAPGNGASLAPVSGLGGGGVGTFLGGSPQVPTIMTIDTGIQVDISPGTTPAGTYTWYVHVLSAGHDPTNGAGGERGTIYGPVNTTISSVANYTATITAAASAAGGTQTELTLSGTNSGSPFNTGDVVTVAGAGPYSGSRTVVSATGTTVIINVPYAGSVTSGTVISVNAVFVGLTSVAGIIVGAQMTFTYATAINSALSTVAAILQVTGSGVAIRGTYNSSGSSTGGATVAPILPVTFTI